jgi:hypothetical protein
MTVPTMEPHSCPSHPPPVHGVDFLSTKEAWNLFHEALESLSKVGCHSVIERQVFREHPKRPGDFSEQFEVRVGKRLMEVDLNFVIEEGLHIQVLERKDGKPITVLDKNLTRKDQYEKYLSTCFLV